MIVPRDFEGQYRLWRLLSSIFGNGTCPEPEPCPTCEPCPEPEPCVQKYRAIYNDNVLEFRERFQASIKKGRNGMSLEWNRIVGI